MPAAALPIAPSRPASRDFAASNVTGSPSSSSYVDLSRTSSPSAFAERARRSQHKASSSLSHQGSASASCSVKGFNVATRSARRSKSAVAPDREGLLKLVLDRRIHEQTHSAAQPSIAPLPTLKEQVKQALSGGSAAANCDHWQRIKRSGSAGSKVLYHPIVQKAHTIAQTVHGDTTRPDGMQVVRHLEETAAIVATLGMDAACCSAALLHECLGPGLLSEADLSALTSNEICAMVSGVAKASDVTDMYGAESGLQDKANTELVLAMLVAIGDARVMLIKLAGRLQQTRNMHDMAPVQRAELVRVTESVYVPLANRMGIWSIKAELEDLCFEVSEPQRFHKIQSAVDKMLDGSNCTISEFMSDAVAELRRDHLHVEDIEGRPKSLRSISDKVTAKGGLQSLKNIHDVLAVRIILPTKVECYQAWRQLGMRWPRLPGREKNYINTPKQNGYQSLHNVYITDSGLPIEVQLRTPAMHWNAEYGIATHWAYKDRSAARGSESAAAPGVDDAVAAAHAHLVAWSRMVLTYGHGVRDYRKTHAAGTEYLRRQSTLSGVTQSIMAMTAHANVDNAELDQRQPSAHARSDGDSARRKSVDGADGDQAQQRPKRKPRRSFEDFVASAMTQPPALKSVLVAVAWGAGAGVFAADAVLGSSTVQTLLETVPELAGTAVTRVLVNGVPALGLTQPLSMGDCVRILPLGERALVAAASRQYLSSMPRPLTVLRRDLMRQMYQDARNVNTVAVQ